MCEGLRCEQNFILILNLNYSFHPAISQEDATKVYVRNISVFFSLFFFFNFFRWEDGIGNKFFDIINSPLKLSELHATLVKFREGSSFIYFKSVSLKLIFEAARLIASRLQ